MRVAPERLDRSEQVGIALSQNPVTAATASTVTLYSADGLIAVQEDGVIADVPQVVCSSTGDDDLTSLTWLQDKNLLKKGVPELPKHEFTDGNASDSTLSNSSASSSSSSKTNINVIPRISYDPQVHVTSKPPFSFSCLIFMAIEDSDEKALPVKDIYVWILNHFPYYRNAPTGWKNSVRHNLSLNKCFKKVDKSPNLGKGSLWMVEQRFRPCLIQALQKTPYHQYQKFIRNLNNNNNDSHSDSGSNKKMISDNDACDIDSKDGIRIFTDNKDEVRILVEESNDVVATSSQGDFAAPPTSAFTPTISLKDHFTDEVDAAATAMLVLKHGACAFDIKAENVNVDFRILDVKKELSEEKPDLANCPNDDHNYGYHNYNANNDVPNDGEKMNTSYWNSAQDMEEHRKIVEGADALLNLAGITTYNTRKRSLSLVEEQQQQQLQQPHTKQLCTESSTEFEQRLKPTTRKEKTLPDGGSTYDGGNDKDEDADDGSDTNSKRSPNVNGHEERLRTQKNRATSTSNRRLRRKIEKKRFKL